MTPLNLRRLAPVLTLAAACGSSPPPVETQPAPPPVTVAVSAAPAPEPSAPATAEPKVAPSFPKPTPPAGYIEMDVLGVAPTPDGQAVLLGERSKRVVLPIFIGGTEAMSIELRYHRRRYQRPLTHDLLDDILSELREVLGHQGPTLYKIHIDDIKDNTFLGTVFVRTGDRLLEIDARPSDAIALAIGNRVPIYVSQKVIDQAAIHKGDLPDDSNAPQPTI